ncbi:MAG: hypothetical protein AB7I04_00040 [Pseudomonadales bacterium]
MTVRMLMFLAACLLNWQANAAELRGGVETATLYNSNIYSLNDTDAIDDVIVRLGPDLELRGDQDRRFHYRLNYQGWYDYYTEETDSSGFQHRERLRLGYDFTPRTTLSFDQRYRYVNILQLERDDFQAGDTGIDVRQNEYHRNDMSLILDHELSRNWSLNLSLDQQTVDFNNNTARSDSDSWGLMGSLSYTLSERHDLGFGVRFVNQDFIRTQNRLAAESDYLGAMFLWTFRISSRVTLSAEGGPAEVQTEQKPQSLAEAPAFVGVLVQDSLFRANINACSPGDGQTQPIASTCVYTDPTAPPIPADDLGPSLDYPLDFSGTDLDDESLEFYGRLGLTMGLSDFQLTAGIARRPSAISGSSLANNIDELTLSLDYGPASSRWRTYGEIRFEKRKALTRALEIDYTLVPGPDDAAVRDEAFLSPTGRGDQDSFAVLVGSSYAFSRNFLGSLEGRYRTLDRSSSAAADSDADTFIVELALRYEFNPERL